MLYFKLEVYQIDKLSAKIFVFSLLAVIKEKTAVRCLQGHQDRFLADKRTQGRGVASPWCSDTTAAVFYSSKFWHDHGLSSLTSCGGPVVLLLLFIKYFLLSCNSLAADFSLFY